MENINLLWHLSLFPWKNDTVENIPVVKDRPLDHEKYSLIEYRREISTGGQREMIFLRQRFTWAVLRSKETVTKAEMCLYNQ